MEQIFNTKLIDDYLKEHNMSKTAFCRKCKIDNTSLKKIYEQKSKINLKIVFKIARVINASIPDILIINL